MSHWPFQVLPRRSVLSLISRISVPGDPMTTWPALNPGPLALMTTTLMS